TPTGVATPTASGTATATATANDTATATGTPTTTPTATPASLCAAAPRGGCHTAGKTLLLVKAAGARSTVLWRWLQGDAPLSELGDPTTATGYALCAYDAAALVPSLALRIEVAPGGTCGGPPCWQGLGGTTPTGFNFNDSAGSQQGMQKLKLKGGTPGRDKLLAKASGAALVLPPPASASQLFAQNDDVIVQLVSERGACWESVFPPSAVTTNRPDLYKAKR
ncbi:MAG: hypothetical protein U0802_26120, partial [Candidatus Binatia bacterium]